MSRSLVPEDLVAAFVNDDDADPMDYFGPVSPEMLGAQPAPGGKGGRGSRASAADLTKDENGYYVSRATTFATPEDRIAYRRTGSLAKGDNGIGFFGGVDTSGDVAYAALPPDILHPTGKVKTTDKYYVEVIAPNGKRAVMQVGDRSPAMSNRHNTGVLELNPKAVSILGGDGDKAGYRWRVIPKSP